MSPQRTSSRKCWSARFSMRPRHMMASSSPARKPIEITLSLPSRPSDPEIVRSRGTILGPPPVLSPGIRPSSPSIRGTENPQMSASSTPTVRPLLASAAARLTVTEDLPTPPLPDAMAITRVVDGISVTGASSRAFQRALAISALFSSAPISPMSTLTPVTPGRLPTRASTSLRSWVRSGQPAMVRATVTVTVPSGEQSTFRTMPSSTMLSPSSGSMTPSRALRTAASAGGVAAAVWMMAIGVNSTGRGRYYCPVDRLPVFKALGDNTRYAIYLELARSTGPLSTGDIAEVLDLHPNTVRPHLERMREVGLLEVDHDNRGTVGRPQHRYRLAADAPSLGLEPPAYPLLAGLLASVAST